MNFDNFDVFSEKASVADADRVQLLDPGLVYPDPDNVRSKIDPVKIDEMAATIRESGQLQPITVAPKDADGRYRIMFGERRWRACQKLGTPVRAIVSKTIDVEQVRIDQFIENDQREDLSTADMIRFVVGQVTNGRSVAELARATGRDRTVLTRYQGLAKAPNYIAALFDDISMRSAVALVQAAKANDDATRAFVAETAAEDMTVLACQRFAGAISAKKTVTPPPVSDAMPEEPQARANEDAADAVETEADERASFKPKLTTEDVSDPEADRAVADTPVIDASAATPLTEDEAPTSKPLSRSKPERAKVERPTLEIEGKRAIVVEALLHFDGEDQPRIVSWR